MHYIYILRCNDETLYTGYTIDLKQRLKAHNQKLGARYTRARLPVELVYHEVFDNKSEALKREYQIKQLSRQEKLILIQKKDD